MSDDCSKPIGIFLDSLRILANRKWNADIAHCPTACYATRVSVSFVRSARESRVFITQRDDDDGDDDDDDGESTAAWRRRGKWKILPRERVRGPERAKRDIVMITKSYYMYIYIYIVYILRSSTPTDSLPRFPRPVHDTSGVGSFLL